MTSSGQVGADCLGKACGKHPWAVLNLTIQALKLVVTAQLWKVGSLDSLLDTIIVSLDKARANANLYVSPEA
jgi:hypothetical protein